MSTVAEALTDALYAAGIRTLFGLPGGETVAVLEAAHRRGIGFELVHSESSALYMADGLSRVSRKPAAAITTLGPGATNALAGVAHAYLDRAPLIFITAQKPDHLLPDYTHQVLDLHALFRPITKRTLALRPWNCNELAHTIALTSRGRPGPVHIQVSNEDAGSPLESERERSVENGPTTSHEDVTALQTARSAIQRAGRPLILVGVGIEPDASYVELRRLAEHLGAPVVVTPKAKGALPDDHPLSAGTVGLTATDPVYTVIDEADLLLAVGFDVVELVRPWQHSAPLIWIANWPNEDPRLPADAELIGPLPRLLEELLTSESQVEPGWGQARVAQFRVEQDAGTLPLPGPDRLLPQKVLRTLRASAPPDQLLAVDVGSHKILSSLEWPTLEPNRFLLSNGLSSMGYGLPAAMGAALGLGKRTLCLTGDGGLLMCLGELGVLSRLQLPVTVLVLVDAALDLIRSAQLRGKNSIIGTEFIPPSFTTIAAAFSIPAARVSTADELAAALSEAQSTGGPFLVEAPIDSSSYPTTPRSP